MSGNHAEREVPGHAGEGIPCICPPCTMVAILPRVHNLASPGTPCLSPAVMLATMLPTGGNRPCRVRAGQCRTNSCWHASYRHCPSPSPSSLSSTLMSRMSERHGPAPWGEQQWATMTRLLAVMHTCARGWTTMCTSPLPVLSSMWTVLPIP